MTTFCSELITDQLTTTLERAKSIDRSLQYFNKPVTFRQKSKSSGTKLKLEAKDSLSKYKKQHQSITEPEKSKLVIKTSFSKSNAFLNNRESRDRTKKICSNSKSFKNDDTNCVKNVEFFPTRKIYYLRFFHTHLLYQRTIKKFFQL